MKIISGTFKGKNLAGYNISTTRPTQDRVKESIFSMIQNMIPDSTVLDLFAGSGNLGIESISNGSSYCYFVDNNKEAIKVIETNLHNCSITNKTVLTMDFKKALSHFEKEKIKFDIIYLDPPYNLNCLEYILQYIGDANLLNQDGIVVCEYENTFTCTTDKLQLWKEKKYGTKYVKIYQSI